MRTNSTTAVDIGDAYVFFRRSAYRQASNASQHVLRLLQLLVLFSSHELLISCWFFVAVLRIIGGGSHDVILGLDEMDETAIQNMHLPNLKNNIESEKCEIEYGEHG